MTAAVLSGLFAYFGAAALVISWVCRRTDAAFVRDMHRVLRSDRRGRSEETGRLTPQSLSVTAGVERAVPHAASAPPAPQSLAGAACPPASAASARPQRRTAVLLMGEPACGYSWGSGCLFGGGSHSCAWPASQCTGAHKCGCGAGASS